jgi:hypothetical protein
LALSEAPARWPLPGRRQLRRHNSGGTKGAWARRTPFVVWRNFLIGEGVRPFVVWRNFLALRVFRPRCELRRRNSEPDEEGRLACFLRSVRRRPGGRCRFRAGAKPGVRRVLGRAGPHSSFGVTFSLRGSSGRVASSAGATPNQARKGALRTCALSEAPARCPLPVLRQLRRRNSCHQQMGRRDGVSAPAVNCTHLAVHP